MTDVLPDPILVTQHTQLQLLAAKLGQMPIIAVDTESNSLHAYQEQVCLIQFSTQNQDYLVDPLALEDLTPLSPIFANPEIEKVFHAAEYDLICLKRDFDFKFRNIFDTMVAARTLGWKKIGLSSILEAEYDIYVDKRYQRANWGQRPLTPPLLNYARLDTHFLIPLRDKLRTDLIEEGWWPVAEEDFTRACHVEITTPTPGEIEFWKVNGAKELSPQETAVLKALCTYRDKIAQKQNRPLFKIMGDHILLEIAQQKPQEIDDLSNVRGMNARQIRRYGQGVLEAVEEGLQAPPAHFPRRPRPDEDYLNRVDALRTWRKRTAMKIKVDSGVILPKDILYDIARENPTDLDSLQQVMAEVPWRFNKFADAILETITSTETIPTSNS